jgi:phosphohistidine phosphatase
VRRLYLLRHAKSGWDDPGLADHERPLAARGLREAAVLGDHLTAAEIAPALVLCSSAKRAVETLEGLRHGLPGGVRVEVEDDLYGATAEAVLARLRTVPAAVPSVLVVGHNPGIEVLARALAGDGDADALDRLSGGYPTAALASLTFTGGWPDLSEAAATLTGFVTGRDLTTR